MLSISREEKRLAAAALAIFGLASFLACGQTHQPVGPILTINGVTSLPERKLSTGLEVRLHGVITLLDPGWRLLAIQDNTGGVLVDWPPAPTNLQIGDEVEVVGATSVDNHVASIVGVSLRVLGKGALPPPEIASAADIACGKILYRFVQVEFTPDEASLGDGVHTARFSAQQPCNRLLVIGRLLRQYSPASLKGRRLRIRGVPLAFYSLSGNIDHVRLMFEDDSDVDVLDPPAPLSQPAPSPGLAELRSLSAVKALPRTQAARGYPVDVEGIVTTPMNPRHDGYFIQQGSTGICIFATRNESEQLRAGERVRILGRTEMGGFAPVIRQSSLEVLGNAPLPRPTRISPGDIFHGWEENLWVEVEGLATAVVSDAQTHQLEFFAGSKRLLVWFSEGDSEARLSAFVGARVLVRGVYSPLYSPSGSLLGFRMFTPSPAMLKIVEPPPAVQEFRSIPSLSEFDPRGAPMHRFRTAGVVTYCDVTGRLYLQDGDSSLQVRGNGPGDPALNTWATVSGFLSPEAGPPRLEHVQWVSTKTGEPAKPTAALAESLASGELEGRLVTVEGFLESRRSSGGELQLELVAGRSHFAASLQSPGSQDAVQDLRPGALLRLTGVSTADSVRGVVGSDLANLWLRTASDIAVVRPAPWWDLRRALYTTFAASLLLLFVLAWVARLQHNLVVQMGIRSKLEEQLLHAQKLESLGRLAGGVAHDFNNYLTVVLGYSSLLIDTFDGEDLTRRQLKTVREVALKAASLTRQLLAFSRKQELQPIPTKLNDIITDAKATLLPLIGEDIEIVMRLGKCERVSVDPAQFLQVLVNLAVNARDAMPHGGKLIFETANCDIGTKEARPEDGFQAGRYVCLSVTDTGAGNGQCNSPAHLRAVLHHQARTRHRPRSRSRFRHRQAKWRPYQCRE